MITIHARCAQTASISMLHARYDAAEPGADDRYSTEAAPVTQIGDPRPICFIGGSQNLENCKQLRILTVRWEERRLQ
jgi:hypothetical protein